MNLYSSVLEADASLVHPVNDKRAVWVQVISGDITANGEAPSAGDGLALTETGQVEFIAGSEVEFLVFELEKGAQA